MSKSGNGFHALGLLGYGVLGAALARMFAAAGCKVIVLERDRSRTAADSTVGVITTVGELSGVDLVVEAVTEDLEVKTSLLVAVAAVVGDRVPILTATSALPVTDLAAALPRPDRVAGLHLIDPASATVEIVRAVQTDESLIDRLTEFVGAIDGKHPVVVPDRPGFLVNALLLPYLNDVITEFDNGLATAEDIDVALELGLGYRCGPLATLDRIGLDTHLRTTEAVYAATRDPRYAPPPLLRRMVAAGWTGVGSDRGFRIGEPSSEGN